jgi:hypothetical protein
MQLAFNNLQWLRFIEKIGSSCPNLDRPFVRNLRVLTGGYK